MSGRSSWSHVRRLVLAVRLVAAVVALARIARARRRTAPLSVPVGTAALSGERLGRISVVVPARNEAQRIGLLLDALRDAPGVAEVIVVDDGSRDATAEMAAAAGARVLKGAMLPDGWAGKAWALQQGIEAATGEWVVTLDADTRPDPRLPVAAVARAAEDGAFLLTLAGRFECPTVGLGVLHPAMLTTLVYRVGPVDADPPPRADRVLANGQCMVFRRQALLDAGGLALVADQVIEDVALARTLAGAGHAVAMVDASSVLTVRMYEDAPDAWNSWGRSLALVGVDSRARQLGDLVVLGVSQALPLPRVLSGRGDVLDLVMLAIRLGTLVGTAPAYVDRGVGYWLSPAADIPAVSCVALGVTRGLRGRPREWRGRTYS